MIKYKTFKVQEEKAINDFLDKNVPQENGVRIVNDNVIILYTDLNADNPANIRHKLATLIGAAKDTVRNHELDLRILRIQQKRKRGGKEVQERLMNDISVKEKEIEFGKDLIAVYEETLAEI